MHEQYLDINLAAQEKSKSVMWQLSPENLSRQKNLTIQFFPEKISRLNIEKTLPGRTAFDNLIKAVSDLIAYIFYNKSILQHKTDSLFKQHKLWPTAPTLYENWHTFSSGKRLHRHP